MEAQTVEKRGKSVEEAIDAALLELGCDRQQVSIDIIEEPSKGLLGLGFGKKSALVRATLIAQESEEEAVTKVLKKLLDKMNLDYRIDKIDREGNQFNINLVGKDKGLLIGRKGETLNAIQFIVSLIVNKARENKVRIALDVEEYRKQRENSLVELANRLSDKVKKTQKNVVMRPMNSQERKVVHTVLQNDPQIITYSLGEEPNRKVVIALKK
ncbi:MAG: protein jag [Syntrophomonadaceae bacterium]|jgi:spoIIIJ-associated protein|nr:protein jag [Syntrophomonadaceae bacterium]